MRRANEAGLGTPLSSRTELHRSGTEMGASRTPSRKMEPRKNSLFKSIGSRELSLESGHFQYDDKYNMAQPDPRRDSLRRSNNFFHRPHLCRSPGQSCESRNEQTRTCKKRYK